MYVYTYTDHSDMFTVGHYAPNGRWVPESDHGSRDEAAARVNYLNGGSGAIEVLPHQHMLTSLEGAPEVKPQEGMTRVVPPLGGAFIAMYAGLGDDARVDEVQGGFIVSRYDGGEWREVGRYLSRDEAERVARELAT